ncbi:MAG: hypothetical protein QOG75_116, partial [Mycobacterium sp.]|nr:hypothetical protein [Mycobacterium sp.]
MHAFATGAAPRATQLRLCLGRLGGV